MLIPFLESFSEEVDKSFMEFLKFCQKSRLVFDLGIRLTVIQEQVGLNVDFVYFFLVKVFVVAIMPNFQLK